MDNALSGRAAPVAVQVKPRRHPAERHPAERLPAERLPARSDIGLPRLRPSEIAAAAGLEAVRRALDDLLDRAP